MPSWLKRLFGPSQSLPNLSDWEKSCRDCGCQNGELHELFCTRERCPFCRGQLISCGCMPKVLGLSAEEQRIIEEQIDDSIEPLKSISERWKTALHERGRVPYRAIPLDPTADGLILAAARGALPFVRALVSAGVPIDATNDVNYTPLMAAARGSATEVVAFLLASGADVHRRDKYGHTPLHCAVGSPSAASERQRACVQLLLDRGSEIDAIDESGTTPLMSASWFGCLPAVRLLLERGASVSKRDQRGGTASDLARERGHEEIAKILSA